MSAKKNTKATTSSGNLPALKIGSRVRCTDDGVTGRITWANGVSVKIRWDDGEQVTWKRDSLAGRPIEILDADDENAPTAAPEPVAPTELPTTEPETAPEQASATELLASDSATTSTVPEQAAEAEVPVAESVAPAVGPTETAPPATEGNVSEPAPTAPAQRKRPRKAKAPAEPKKKVSALDAAARILGETGQAMTTKELIGAMAAKGYWTSPGGQTPAATLYSALLREIATQGGQARFVKAAPGRFALRSPA